MTIHIDMTTNEVSTRPAPEPAGVEAVAFHRLARASSNHRWWRPILVGVIGVAIYGAALLLLGGVLMLGAHLSADPESAMDFFFQDPDAFDLSDPFSFAFMMLLLILLIPALLLATKIAGAKPVGLLSSVVGRLRWRWLATCGVAALAIYAVGITASFVVAAAQGESLHLTFDIPRTLVLLALTVTLVPLQAAAEEYVFRGYLIQAIGSWLRHPAFSILLPVPLFVLGHEYGPLGMTDVAVFAIATGYLTWRTGGLEAALAFHIVGNVSVCALAAVGIADINATEFGVPDLLLSLLVTLTFAALALRLARHHSIQRTSQPTPSPRDVLLVSGPGAGQVGAS